MSDDLSGDMLAPSWPNLVSSDLRFNSNISGSQTIIYVDNQDASCTVYIYGPLPPDIKAVCLYL